MKDVTARVVAVQKFRGVSDSFITEIYIANLQGYY